MAVLNNTGIRAGASGATGVSAYKIEKSLRLDGGDDAHLNRTFGSGGSTTTWTLSFWVKGHDIGQACYTFTGGTGTSSYINAFDVGQFRFYSSAHDLKTNARYRDPSAWYHVVVVANTTDSTANDRTKVYINGTRLAVADFATHTQPSQSAALGDFNSAAAHYINRLTSGSQEDMMLAEVHFVDAAAKEASDFGETHEDTGQWIPKKYTGSYGTTGFYLKFNGTDLGEDSAGSNDWTANNLLASQGNSHYFTITSDATDSYYTNSKDCINTGAGSQSTGTLASVLNSDGSMSSNNQVGATGTTAGYIEVEFNPYIETSSEFSIYGGYWGNGTYEITATITYADDSTDTETSSGGHSQFTFRHSFSTSGKSVKKAKMSGQSTYMCMSGFTKENSGTPILSEPLNADASTDSPTPFSDGGNGTGNYATWNPLYTTNATLAQGNLSLTSSSGYAEAHSTQVMTSGKWYMELDYTKNTGDYITFGIGQSNRVLAPGDGVVHRSEDKGWKAWVGYLKSMSGGSIVYDYSSSNPLADGHVISLAFDADNGKLWCALDGTWITNGSGQGNPATGANPDYSSLTYSGGYQFQAGPYNNANLTANFGQRPFKYTPPTGFKALNIYNWPDPTIADPTKHFDTKLYTGTESSNNVTGYNFSPDLVYIKGRQSVGGAIEEGLPSSMYDTVRGTGKRLKTSEDSIEDTGGETLKTFNSDGFTVGTSNEVNEDTQTYVAWAWEGVDADVTNDASSTGVGTIDSTYRANTTAGFSVVTYTGNNTAGATVAHGLGAKPSFMLVKNRDTSGEDWIVYHTTNGAGKYMKLNADEYPTTSSSPWNDTEPTTTVFSLGAWGDVNGSSDKMVAFCWSEVEGYSKFGSYSGNGNADGPFVWCGFKPAYVLIKRNDHEDNWQISDNARQTYNPNDNAVWADDVSGESAGTGNYPKDFLSNGFKIRVNHDETNNSSGTYIFAAFAESPFKYANAQ